MSTDYDFEKFVKKCTNTISKIKPVLSKIEKIGAKIKTYDNVFDKSFYLQAQDELSKYAEQVFDAYFKVHAWRKTAEALALLAIKAKYTNSGEKTPAIAVLEAEVKNVTKEAYLTDKLLESWYEIVKNYIQTCRNHVNAVREVTE